METLADHLESLQFTVAVCTIPIVCLLGLIFAAIHRVADTIAQQTVDLRHLAQLLARILSDRDRDPEIPRETARRNS